MYSLHDLSLFLYKEHIIKFFRSRKKNVQADHSFDKSAASFILNSMNSARRKKGDDNKVRHRKYKNSRLKVNTKMRRNTILNPYIFIIRLYALQTKNITNPYTKS